MVTKRLLSVASLRHAVNVSSASPRVAALTLVREARDGSTSPGDQLGEIMRRFSEWHVEQHQVARVVYHEHSHLTPAHQVHVLGLRKEIDRIVRSVLEAGVAAGEFDVDDVPDTALALLPIVIDVARWYSPTIKRAPAQIGATNAALGLRLVGSRR